ncbi:MAG TPA: MerR family transcriptional regulator [Thermoanaerobaculia bacterium]|nr:MerR family transcriptional regulator [Thermoanaerobaculia bacterium]
MPRPKDNGKLFYKIGEACKALDIQPYVLRYWETEFPALAPSKSRSGQRVYSEKELAIIRRIKELLYDEGYTIAGAKKKLEAELTEDGELLIGEEGGEPAAMPARAAVANARPDAPPTADPAAEERLRRLREGVERALAEARELAALLRR